MKLLWIGKAAEGGGGGDEIYDRKILNILDEKFEISRLGISKQSLLHGLLALLRGVPHPRYRYVSPAQLKKARALIEASSATVVSLEALEGYVPKNVKGTVLIVHNVMSDALTQIFPRSKLAVFAALVSKAWESALYRQSDLRIVCLSQRDRSLILSLAPGASVRVAPPGCPSPARLSESSVILKELFISGTYGWWPKRRDVNKFAKEYAELPVRLPVLRDVALPDSAELLLNPGELLGEDLNGAVRFGIIPDRFLAGFKLKATFYISKNCICLTFADLGSEFAHIEDADLFIRHISEIDDIGRVVDDISARDPAEICARFAAFKERCLAEFSWDSSAAKISEAILAAKN